MAQTLAQMRSNLATKQRQLIDKNTLLASLKSQLNFSKSEYQRLEAQFNVTEVFVKRGNAIMVFIRDVIGGGQDWKGIPNHLMKLAYQHVADTGYNMNNVGTMQNLRDQYVADYYAHYNHASTLPPKIAATETQITNLQGEIDDLERNIDTIEIGESNLMAQGLTPEEAGEIAMRQFEAQQALSQTFNYVKIAALVLAVLTVCAVLFVYARKNNALPNFKKWMS